MLRECAFQIYVHSIEVPQKRRCLPSLNSHHMSGHGHGHGHGGSPVSHLDALDDDDDDEDGDVVEFTSLSEVHDYLRTTGQKLSDDEMRVIAAGIAFRGAWAGIADWEDLHRSDCPETYFVKLLQNPGPSWKARVAAALGWPTPFDRHDYLVDRCGTLHRYIVDFYAQGAHDFTVDARPAVNGGAGLFDRAVRMPLQLMWSRVRSALGRPAPAPARSPPRKAPTTSTSAPPISQ